jgi:hypothetical protein
MTTYLQTASDSCFGRLALISDAFLVSIWQCLVCECKSAFLRECLLTPVKTARKDAIGPAYNVKSANRMALVQDVHSKVPTVRTKTWIMIAPADAFSPKYLC